jgi:Stress responsive A/B Barrel Domain
MIRRVVLRKWKEGTTAADVEAVTAGLSTLPGQIPQIRSYTHGPDVGGEDGAFDYGIVAEFDDLDAWRAYDVDAVHEKVRADFIRPHLAGRAVINFTL